MSQLIKRLLTLLLLLCAACPAEWTKTPTQVLLRVSASDQELLRRTSSLRISVSSFEAQRWQDVPALSVNVNDFDWPLEVPIFPRKGSDESREFQVIVEALEDDQVLAETRALARFAAGRHKRLDLELYLCPDHEPGFVCADATCRGEDCAVCSKRGSCEPVGTLEDLPDAPRSGDGLDNDGDPVSEGDAALEADADTETTTAEDADSASAADADTPADASANLQDAGMDAGETADASTRDAGSDSGARDGGSDAGTLEACPTSLVRCGDTCVNLSSNASHCGRCERACRSNMCSAGACAATSIYSYTQASGSTAVLGSTAIDPPFVYFQDPAGSNVQRVTTSGSAPSLVSYSAPAGLVALRVDSGYLYALSPPSEANRSVLRMPLSGDSFATIMGSTQGLIVINMTTNTNQVIVSSTLSRNYVQSIAKSGATGFTLLSSGPSLAFEVEADDSFVYFRDASAILRSSATSETTPSAVAAFENAEVCRDFALTTDRVIFATSQRVAITAKTGGTVKALANMSGVYVIADAENAYFVHGLGNDTCSSGTELYRVPLAGGAATRIAVEAASCRGTDCCGGPLMQDGAALYWVRGNGLAIRRVEK